jgi:hypothetical protein
MLLLLLILVCLAHALPIIDLGLNKDTNGWDAAISAALQPPLPTPTPVEPVQIVVYVEGIEMVGVYCKELEIILVSTYQLVSYYEIIQQSSSQVIYTTPTPVEPVNIVVYLEGIEMAGVYCKELEIILVSTYQPVSSSEIVQQSSSQVIYN